MFITVVSWSSKICGRQFFCCYLPKIQTKSPNLRVFRQEDANGIANSEDPDQTDLGLHCLPRLICPKTYDDYGILIWPKFYYKRQASYANIEEQN